MSRSCTVINSSTPATADCLLETEFEAAEILANLFTSTLDATIGGAGGAGESVDSWGSRNKRSIVRVKSESLPFDSPLKEKKPVILAFDLNEDQAVILNQEKDCQRETNDIVKTEDAELPEPSPACTESHTGGKLTPNLQEDDKEARRLRRVMANRESARQTIRRRQALYEELTKKVADLGQENENLKREKESAVKDYEALKCTNKELNEQAAEQLRSKLEENVGKSISAHCSFPAPRFANHPFIIYKDAPFVCPFGMQLPDMNPSQLGHYGNAHLSDTSNSESPIGKGNPSSIRGPSGHWSMVPYPLFFPMPDAKNGSNLIPFFPAGDKEDAPYMDNQHTGTYLSSEYNQQLISQSKLVVNTSSQQRRTNSEAVSPKGARVINVFQESQQEPSMKYGGKRLVDPAAATEARKRRKELTKMKHMHCRAHRK